jgi:hypothetical protein
MREIRTSGSTRGDGKRSVAAWPKLPRPILDYSSSTDDFAPSGRTATSGLMQFSKTASLFDHLVGGREQRQRHGQSEYPGRDVVDDELELGRLHDRQVRRLGTLENPAGIDAT